MITKKSNHEAGIVKITVSKNNTRTNKTPSSKDSKEEETHYKPKNSRDKTKKDKKDRQRKPIKKEEVFDEISEKRPLEDSDFIEEKRGKYICLPNNEDKGQEKDIVKSMIDIEEIKRSSSSHILLAHGDIEHSNEFMNQLYVDLQMKHPCQIYQGEVRKIPICAKTGCYCCCQSCRKSDIESLGIGLIIYFKLMKGLLLAFALISLVYAPIYYIYFNNHREKIAYNYNDYLFKTTIGNIGSTLYNCKSYELIQTMQETQLTFNLDCYERNISKVTYFGTAQNQTEEKTNNRKCFNYISINDLGRSDSCDLTKEFDITNRTNCNNTSSCSFDIDMTQFTQCIPTSGTSKLYLVYSCFDGAISLGEDAPSISRNIFGYVVVSVDLFSMIVIIVTLSCIAFKHKRDFEQYSQTSTFIRDFTLSLSKVVVDYNDITHEIGDLITHFKNVMSTTEAAEYIEFTPNKQIESFGDYDQAVNADSFQAKRNYCLHEIVYPKITCEKLDAIQKLNKLQKELHKLEIKNGTLLNRKATHEENAIVIHNQSHIKETAKENKLKEKIAKLNNVIEKESDVKRVKEFYLTFRNNRIAKYLNDKYKISKCYRCLLIFMCRKGAISLYYYKGKWLNLSFAKDEPTNLKWENMTYSPCKRCLRKTVSVLIAIIIMAGTVIAIFYAKTFQAQMSKDYNTSIDCSYFKAIPETEVEAEFTDVNLASKEKVKSYCYCSNKMQLTDIVSNQIADITLPGGSQPCKTFMESYYKFTALNTLIIVIIPIVNTIVMIIFKALTSFERNTTLSKDMRSNLWKIFIITFVNTGLLLVIINFRIEFFIFNAPNFPFFAGEFTDFDPGWYNRVGVVILFSMALDIVTPHIASMLFVFVNHCNRCIDGGCSGGKRTKTLTKEDYFNIYTGPVFEIEGRYASLLSSFFVLMMFSPGLPFLYLCFLLNIFITYGVDKLLIFKFYRNPPKYDLSIIDTFLFFCFIALLIHFPFAIWIYGNPYLLRDASPNKLAKFKQSIGNLLTSSNEMVNSIVERVTLGHNLILLVGFFTIVLIIIIFSIINCVRLMKGKKAMGLQKGLNSLSNIEIGLAVTLRDAYKTYIIKKIEYSLLRKMKVNEKIQAQLDNLLQGMQYLRSFITYKLEKLTRKKSPKLHANFDAEIIKVKEELNIERKGLIADDVSYDILFNPEFEDAAYQDYLKKL